MGWWELKWFDRNIWKCLEKISIFGEFAWFFMGFSCCVHAILSGSSLEHMLIHGIQSVSFMGKHLLNVILVRFCMGKEMKNAGHRISRENTFAANPTFNRT